MNKHVMVKLNGSVFANHQSLWCSLLKNHVRNFHTLKVHQILGWQITFINSSVLKFRFILVKFMFAVAFQMKKTVYNLSAFVAIKI